MWEPCTEIRLKDSPIAAYRDKAIRGRTLALLNEKSKQPQIEHEQKGIPMPENFKELIKDLKK